jgi:hypothetical protein
MFTPLCRSHISTGERLPDGRGFHVANIICDVVSHKTVLSGFRARITQINLSEKRFDMSKTKTLLVIGGAEDKKGECAALKGFVPLAGRANEVERKIARRQQGGPDKAKGKEHED